MSKPVSTKLSEEIFQDSFLPRSSISIVFSFVTVLVAEKVSSSVFSKLVQSVVESRRKQSVGEQVAEALENDGELNLLFNGTFAVLEAALKKKLTEKEFATALKEFKIPQVYADLLLQAFVTSYDRD